MSRIIRLFLVVSMGVVMTEPDFAASSANAADAGYDRPYGNARQSRSVVMARHGIVATSHPLAAQAGLDVLKAGGNAADAAIAANAMLGVVEPMSCGIGGDLFAIYWDAKTNKLYGLNASGRSGHRATREEFARRGLKQIPIHGPLSWSVPGCVSGWRELNTRFGSRQLRQLLAPAIKTAEDGFPVSEIIAGSWREPRVLWPSGPILPPPTCVMGGRRSRVRCFACPPWRSPIETLPRMALSPSTTGVLPRRSPSSAKRMMAS